MSLFGNKNVSHEEVKQSNSTNTIAKGTTITGNVDTFGNFRLDGKLVGDLRSKSKVFIGQGSHVDGNIFAQNAEVEGEITGKIEISESLVLRATAVVHGDIFTGKLTIDPGATFNGQCHMGDAKSLKAPTKNEPVKNTASNTSSDAKQSSKS